MSRKAILLTFSWTVLLSLVGSQNFRVNGGRVFPSQQTLDTWADKLDSAFKLATTGEGDITGASQLQQRYQESFDSGVGYDIEHANGEQIIRDMTVKISAIFDKNIAALKNLQERAEGAIKDYNYNENLRLINVNYTNVNHMHELINPTKIDGHFKQPIYTNTSGVHIPIEIYEGYPEILNGIVWSSALDKAFKENRQNYPGIYWQSFGSQDGFLRVYPATQWRSVDDLPDLFDVRRRPWYIHGTSSPKDMVILLDTSGSMHGQSFDIMKIAAKTLLNTLGENDYVNVAAFAQTAKWVTPCLDVGNDTLVQANARNKRLLFDGIDQLKDRQIASYTNALKFAYEALENFERRREPQEGSDCHKLIMVFSDGGTESPKKILDVYTNKTRSITANARIFTYAVGPHPLPTVALKNMACSTRGAFTTITAMGAIRTKIQDYVRILNRPLVLSKIDDFLRITYFSRDKLGLGFVTTMTMPVFNTSMHSDNQTLAGVVGIDIPVSRFESFCPRSQLGPLGYTFGINANGFLIFHPDLWMVANYLEDPAHNDMADVEGDSDQLTELRKEMIDMADSQDVVVGKMNIATAATFQQGHAAQVDMEYFYSAIKGTSFSMAVVLPKNWNHIKVPEQPEAKSTLDSLLASQTYLLAPWKFCDETKQDEDSEADTLEHLIAKLSSGQCHGNDLNHLAWDVKNTLEWFDRLKPVGIDKDHPSRFALTDGGLVMFKPQGAKKDYLKHFQVDNPYNSSLYKTAVLSSTPVLYVQRYVSREVVPIYIHTDLDEEDFEEEDFENSTTTIVQDHEGHNHYTTSTFTDVVVQARPPTVHLAQSVFIKGSSSSGRGTVVGVAGVQLSSSRIKEMLLNATITSDGSKVAGLDCRNSSELYCYMTDTSGYVLASNQPESSVSMGDFLGVADAQIMQHLVDKQLFGQKVEYNYQALCPTEVDCRTAGASSIIRSLLAQLAYSILAVVQQLNYGIISLLAALHLPVETSGGSEYGRQTAEGRHRCTTKTVNWYWNNYAEPKYQDRVDIMCNEVQCARDFHLYKLENINALLIVADPKWCEVCKQPPLFDGPLEVHPGEDCLLPKRYRKRPSECFAMHDDEVSECSGRGHTIRLTTPLLLIIIIIPFRLFLY